MNTNPWVRTGSARGLPLLLLAYASLMMHFIFSRAFRDSLLGSHLNIRSLPYLTLWGTVFATIVSLAVSGLLRSKQRALTVRRVYLVNALIEVLFSLECKRVPWLYSLYYIEVSASTAVGLSMIWILIGDWASSCNADRNELIPNVMVYGTASGILAGVGLTRLRIATSFVDATLMLAAMNVVSALALAFYSSDYCLTRPRSALQDLLQSGAYLTNKLLRKFAVLTIVAATASTLLDLMFRVRVAEHYLLQSDRLHFLGLFQSMLNLSALLFQAAMGSLLHKKKGLRFFHLHPAILFIASCFTTFAPGFWAFTFLRGGEYSLRNSLYRLGSELTYACLPDDKRGAIRPLIDVIGERLGDVCASGILAFLLFVNPKLPVKLGLLLLALCSLMFWWMCRSLEGELTAIGITARRDLALSQTANYGAIAQESAGIF